MLRLTLAQMRRSLGRLTAAGVAIAIGTAFVAATLIAGAVITRTSYDAVAASYADADLVVTSDDSVSAATVEALAQGDAVAAVDGRLSTWVELSNGSRRTVQQLVPVASDPRLDAQRVVDGRSPDEAGEIALPPAVAERLGVGIGDTLTAHVGQWADDAPGAPADGAAADGAASDPGVDPGVDPEAGPRWVERTEELTVVGVVQDPYGAYAQSGGAGVLTRAELEQWAGDQAVDGGDLTYDSAVVALADGADVEAARAALGEAVPADATVRTKDEQAQVMTAELTDGADVFTVIVLCFAAVALLVAALVISNTFQVLIAQRTRTLALLRCVGADRRQLRGSVLLEATLLGLAASLAGLLLGTGAAQAALWALGRMSLEVPLPATVSITPAVVLVPLLVGTLVTVLASFAPARAATRVAPLAALRPADAPAVTQRRNRPRLVLSVLLTVGGFALLAIAAVFGRSLGDLLGPLVGVLGGALSFVGVVVGSVFWLPRVVGACGRLVGRGGASARLAAANTVRNPRRTAATSTALLIGVTLVTMMSTGAASARVTLSDELDRQFPVDVELADGGAEQDGAAPLVGPALLSTVRAVDGVELVTTVAQGPVLVTATDGATGSVTASAIEPADATALLRTPSMVTGLSPDTVVVAQSLAQDLGLSDGDTVSVSGTETDPSTGAETAAGDAVQRTVVVTELPGGVALTPTTFSALTVPDAQDVAWARLADGADPSRVVPAIQDAVSDTAVMVTGAAVERALFEGIIDTLLAVVVGLLAVAVVIALIGVANTLSLSVLERRRESATLRVIGLSRSQLRGTLAIEGVLIAGVGAVLGIGLGVVYGWAGAVTVLGVVGDVSLEMPWGDLALVLAVALAAGLLASVLPARSAARTSPVAALAVD
ncbi:ABC transporter permease [uncultured Cellulomonas sp.]|uniref:ABC transporter permease n=1 Tax=uncultured Cellulomonas sp. TaxID=189682 RepID=UPI0026238D6C|nr:ABC transporter permease [uncultured Cellulomonas sp.]